jgi:solute carrier family 25 carnitine/acylcarnitine transporter 20/29
MELDVLRGFVCGVVFGIASPVCGHPFDSLKSKMQAQPSYTSGSSFATLRTVVRQEGFLALWRGLTPPLLGSMIFRSLQFSSYNGTMRYFGSDDGIGRAKVPFAAGLEWRVVFAATAATSIRSVIETPLEYVKVRMQTSQRISLATVLRDPVRQLPACYTGFRLTWLRLWFALGGFFVLCDHFDRHHADLLRVPFFGPLVKGSVCATAAWWVAWPLEVVKNQVQAGFAIEGLAPNAGMVARLRHTIATRGLRGLYRGIGPGTARSLAANGSAMVAFTFCNSCFDSMSAPS